jgi:hypothetical protein
MDFIEILGRLCLKIGGASREGLDFLGQKKIHRLNIPFKQA